MEKEDLIPEKVQKKIHNISFIFTALVIGVAVFWICQLIFGIAVGFTSEADPESGTLTMEKDIGHDYCGTFFIWLTVGSNYKSLEDYQAYNSTQVRSMDSPLGIADNLIVTAAPVTFFLCMFLTFRKAEKRRFFAGNGWRLLMIAGCTGLAKSLWSIVIDIIDLTIEHKYNAGVFAGSRYYCQAYQHLGIPVLIILTALVMRHQSLSAQEKETGRSSKALKAAAWLTGLGAAGFILVRFLTRIYEIICYRTHDAALPFYHEMLPFPRELADSPETYRNVLLFRLLKDLPVFAASALTVVMLLRIMLSSAEGRINTKENIKRFDLSMAALAVSSVLFNVLGLFEVDMINGHFSGIYGKVTYTIGIRALCEPMLYVLILWFVKIFFSMAGNSGGETVFPENRLCG